MPRHNVFPALALAAIMAFAGCGPARAAEDPRPERSTLDAPQVIEDVPCGPGYLWRFPDGRLHRCTLDRDAVVRGAALPKGAAVAFNAAGDHAYVFLPQTTTIEGYECRGHGHDFMTVFHPNGRLKLCWLPESRTVQGIPCAGFSVWSDIVSGNPSGVYLHPDGALAECRLSADVSVAGTRFRKGTRIFLDPAGKPVENPRTKTGR